ncbi:MAG: peptide chain release factor N(5)-glutamine methyltransferase [SAR202 cluster bacterium]|nr:peptide chain release factor N(5)-glutamine methyltransferase [SAR202 cluster bacterium]
MSTLGALLRQTEARLAKAGIPDARLEAELLWTTALNTDRTHLYAMLRDTPGPAAAEAARQLIVRRLDREPVFYIMGHREFHGHDLLVSPGVLIPRQDTETLVDEALRLLAALGAPNPIVADVGCGSGAIAIAIAAAVPGATVHAIDVSDAALALTARNADRLGLGGRVWVVRGDLLQPLPEPADVIAANLPYVMSGEIPTLEPEVSRYEPRIALDGGETGMVFIERLLREAPGRLRPRGTIVLEMDPRQIEAASRTAREAFPGAAVRPVRDMARRERVLVIET